MAQIIWTEPALADLNEIAEYIAIDKPNAASSLVKQVFSSVDNLEQFPELGRTPPELKLSTYREIIVDPCRIFYRIDQQYLRQKSGSPGVSSADSCGLGNLAVD